MENKKEVQIKILKEKRKEKVTKEETLSILRQVSPGTNLRASINGIVRAQKGALIVVGTENISDIFDGGFKINCRFTPQRIIELSKMDGAIILSKDMKRITHANVTLSPEKRIPTKETGTRHKAAERTGTMMNTLVIAVSERRKEVTLYYKNLNYKLREIQEIMSKAIETLHLLEKQRELFDEFNTQLTLHEIYDDLDIIPAIKVIQKGASMEKILKTEEKTLIELGNEGIALKQRVKELLKGVERKTNLVIKDYTKLNFKKSKKLISSLTYEEIIDSENIITALAQKETNKIDGINGWRILSGTSLSEKEISELIQNIGNLKKILECEEEKIKQIITEEKANNFMKELGKIKNQ